MKLIIENPPIRPMSIVAMEASHVVEVFKDLETSATSIPIDCLSKNGLILTYDVDNIDGGSFQIALQGGVTATDTFRHIGYLKEGTQYQYAITITGNHNRNMIIGPGLPNYVRIIATRSVSGTLSLSAQPIII